MAIIAARQSHSYMSSKCLVVVPSLSARRTCITHSAAPVGSRIVANNLRMRCKGSAGKPAAAQSTQAFSSCLRQCIQNQTQPGLYQDLAGPIVTMFETKSFFLQYHQLSADCLVPDQHN